MNDKLNMPDPALESNQVLSALMDGELDADAVVQACGSWSQDAGSRATWHAYHLIGDVLRSEDLATPPACDEAFMQALRARLVLEPVPLAPAPLLKPPPAPAGRPVAAGRSATRWWMAPAAVAAGFVAVAGLLVVTRAFSPDMGEGAVLAKRAPAGASEGVVLTAGALVRNPGLDRYLEAHRSLANGVVVAGGAEHRVQIVLESK